VADGEPANVTEATAAGGTHAPDATGVPSLRARIAHKVMPHTFQGRLTLAFVAILALTLTLVSTLVLNRLGDYFDQQQRQDLEARSTGVAQFVALVAERASDPRPVISAAGVVDSRMRLTTKSALAERSISITASTPALSVRSITRAPTSSRL